MLRFMVYGGSAWARVGTRSTCAAAVALAVAVVLAPSSAAARGSCALKGGTVVAKNGELSVSRRPPLQESRDRTRRVYFVCRFKDGRQRHLVTSDESIDPFVSRVRVAGGYVAWAEQNRMRDQYSRVAVLNTRTQQKRRTQPWFGACVRELFLTATGSAVWSQTGDACASSTAPLRVLTLDPSQRTLVRTPPGIDPGSLVVVKRRVSWRVGGMSASAKLRR